MYELFATIEQDVRFTTGMSERAFRRYLKSALKETAIYWHRRFAGAHFLRKAWGLYGRENYPKFKKQGNPLVETGTLRKRILARKGISDVTGSSKGVRLTMKYGRPPRWTQEEIDKQIAIEMNKSRISYRAAQRKVYSKAGYGKRNRELFQRAITATTETERDRMGTHIKLLIMRAYRKPGRRRRRVLRGI